LSNDDTNIIINTDFRNLIFQIDVAKRRLGKYREVFILHIRRAYNVDNQNDFATNVSNNQLIESEVVANSISNENICDIAIFFFLYKELPWWSSIREVSVLQNLMQNLVVKSPIVFKNRILNALDAYPDILENIMLDLKLNNLTNESVKLDKDIDELLKNDLEFVLLVLNSNPTLSYLKSIVFEIVINIKKFRFIEKHIIDIFRKSVVQTFRIEESLDFLKLLEAAPKSSLQAEYELIYNKVILDDKVNYRSSKNFFNLLLDIEKKYNTIEQLLEFFEWLLFEKYENTRVIMYLDIVHDIYNVYDIIDNSQMFGDRKSRKNESLT
jgi:hypothetical protein